MTPLPHLYIKEVSLSSGQILTLGPHDRILIVGPNNSGKSRLLKDIEASFSSNQAPSAIVVLNVNVELVGDWCEVRKYVRERGVLKDAQYHLDGTSVHQVYLGEGYPESQKYFGSLFVKRVSAEDRLLICEPQSSVPPGQPHSKPQHDLYASEALMERISSLFFRAFSKRLFFNFRGGPVLPIHVGDPPVSTKKHDRVSDKYVQQVIEQPSLHEQGDGMRSYAGLLFEAVVSKRSVTLVDEPEAFLHPPQMRKLGSALASETSGQLFCATHSAEVLRGFLDATAGTLRVLRIRQEANKNFADEADPSAIKELWSRPSLRYSNALDAIFHEQAVICEDDSDCRLYNAVEDYLVETNEIPLVDTAYIPAGGKDAIPKIAAILRKMGVRLRLVFDIDVLATPLTLRSSILVMGGKWEEVADDVELVQKAVCGVDSGILTQEELRSELRKLCDDPRDISRGALNRLFDKSREWTKVKRKGKDSFGDQVAKDALARVMARLSNLGIFVVPAGEPEAYCKEIDVKGSAFVTKLLEQNQLGSEALQELRAFVKEFSR